MDDAQFIREFQALASDVKYLRERLDDGLKHIDNAIAGPQGLEAKMADLDKRITALERWRYLMVGAALAGGTAAGGIMEAIQKAVGGG